MQTTNNILSDNYIKFLTNFKSEIQMMKNCSHFYSSEKNILNNYHLEDDVWTHTVCAYTHLPNLINFLNNNITENELNILTIAILLHDIGKINSYSYNDIKETKCFYGHENASNLFIINNKNKLCEIFKLTNIDINHIMLLINAHVKFNTLNDYRDIYKLLNHKTFLVKLFFILNTVDHCGRISNFYNNLNEDYIDNNKYLYDAINNNYEFEINERYNTHFNKKLIIMVGLPGVGKDYFINETFTNKKILSFDQIRIDLYKQYNPNYLQYNNNELYQYAFEYCQNKKINFNNIIEKQIKDIVLNDNIDNIIISNTNLYNKSRRFFINIAHNLKLTPIIYCILSDINTIYQRNINRKNNDKYIDKSIIDKMANNFNIPTKYENVNTIRYIWN